MVHSLRKTIKWLRILCVLIGFFLSTNIFSQELILKGSISTTDDIDIEGINIYNLSTNKGTISDGNGAFRIAASLNDTLSVSAVHIQNKILVIGAEQLANKEIRINLSEKMTALGTVTLRRSLTGYIGSDANIIPIEKPITATSIGLPNADLPQLTKTRRQLYAATSGPVDALVNMLSGRT